MIVHIMPYMEAFTMGVVKFIQNKTRGNHFFYIFCFSENVYVDSYKNIKVLSLSKNSILRHIFAVKLVLEFLYILLTNKNIIFHSLFLPRVFFVAMSLVPNFKKINWNWIVFGGDLYDKREYTYSSSFLAKSFFKLKLCQVKQFGYITTLTKGDYALAKDFYNVSGKNYVIIYGDPQKLKTTISTITESGKDKANDKKNDQQRTIKILIGNSATKENQHEEVLYILSKYANENIEIFVPLSYGDMSYKINIQDLGHKIFGEKFHAITDFMAYKDYVSFLNSIDIGIFNNNRQQALGNLYLLNGLGKKVFIRKDTSMWEHFHNKLGLKIFPVESIINLSFDDFIFIDEIDIINNRSNMDTFLTDDENGSDVWNQLIFDMESRS